MTGQKVPKKPPNQPRMAAGFGAVFFFLKRSLSPVCRVRGPAEGDKPLSLIHACFFSPTSSQVLFFFFSSSALLLFGLKYCFYEK